MRTEHWPAIIISSLAAIIAGALVGALAGDVSNSNFPAGGGQPTGSNGTGYVLPQASETPSEEASPSAETSPRAGVATPKPTFTPIPPPEETTAPETATPAPPEATATPAVVTYVIQEGDTIARIAQRLGVSTEEILNMNPGIRPEALTVGQTINLPALPPGTSVPFTATPAP